MATSLTLQYQDGGKVFKDDVRAIKDALEKLNTTKENTKKDSIRYSVENFLKIMTDLSQCAEFYYR